MPRFFHRVRPASFFIFAAVLFEVLLFFVVPPLQAPDEFNHFYRTWQIAEGRFLPLQEEKRLGGEIPYDISDFVAPFKMASYVMEYRPPRNGRTDVFNHAVSKERAFRDFPNTAYYCPVSYLPQAVAVFVLKSCGASVPVLYYGGRLFSFMVNLLIFYCAIRIMPVYKWLFTLLALLPMNLFLLNSFSADNVTNSVSFLFIALVFQMALGRDRIPTRVILFAAGLGILLALAKLVYVGLVLLLLIIPVHRFCSRRQWLFVVPGTILLAFLAAYVWSAVVMKSYLTYETYNPQFRDVATIVPGASYHAQKAYILEHPAYFPEVIVRSIFNPHQTYLSSYIGCFGAFLDVPLPAWLCWLAYGCILFMALTEGNEKRLSWRTKLILLGAVCCCFTLLLLSQHLTWDPVGKGRVDLIQGRYLIPLFPLLFMLPGNLKPGNRIKPAYLVLPFVVLINSIATWVMYQRYIYEPYTEEISFTCDAEQMDTQGNFKTSSAAVILQGCSNQSNTEKRNGNFSAQITAACPYCFTYVFKGLQKGDMVDISAWRKGNAGLAMTGNGKRCESYYNEFNDAHYVDRMGWTSMHGILVISQPCDSIDLGVFFRNNKQDTAYIDDLTFTVKRRIARF